MPRTAIPRLIALSLVCALLFAPVTSPGAFAQPGYRVSQSDKQPRQQDQHKGKSKQKNGNQQEMSAQQAAAKAQSRHGGRVLKVEPKGNGYNVRLLKDDGRVINVFIGD